MRILVTQTRTHTPITFNNQNFAPQVCTLAALALALAAEKKPEKRGIDYGGAAEVGADYSGGLGGGHGGGSGGGISYGGGHGGGGGGDGGHGGGGGGGGDFHGGDAGSEGLDDGTGHAKVMIIKMLG